METEQENVFKRIFKKREPKKTITYILKGAKILVFFSFMYVATVLFRLDQDIYGILILISVAVYMILNVVDKLEAGG